MHSYLRIGSLGQPLESSLKLHCSLLPHMKGFWSPVTPALAQPWCTLPLLHLDPHCHLDAHCQATYHLCLLTCPESRDHVRRQPTVLWVLCYPWFTKRDTKYITKMLLTLVFRTLICSYWYLKYSTETPHRYTKPGRNLWGITGTECITWCTRNTSLLLGKPAPR